MTSVSAVIVGFGYVGQSIARLVKDHCVAGIYDPPQGYGDRAQLARADIVFVCVPTPTTESGGADVSLVEATVATLPAPLIIIKSTVPPGTTARLADQFGLASRLVFSPAYIGEDLYPVPSDRGLPHPAEERSQPFHIFGGHPEATRKAATFYQTLCGPYAKYIQTDATTAELAKYMENVWIGAKVAFCNDTKTL